MARQLLLVATLCHILSLTIVQSQDEYVLTMAVNYNNNKFVVNFSTDRFLDFYRCLCKITTSSCSAHTIADRVTHIQELYFQPLRSKPEPAYNRYLCQHVLYDKTIVCSKFQASQSNCSATNNCYTYHFQGENSELCPFEPVAIVWIFTQLMEGSYIFDVLRIRQCLSSCVVDHPSILDPHIISTTLTPTKSLKKSSTSTQNDSRKSTESSTSSLPQDETESTNVSSKHPAESSNSSTHNEEGVNQNPDDSNTKGTTIGLVLSFLLVSIAVSLLTFFLCRRRKTAFLFKSNGPDPPTDRGIPTLTQLHYIDSTYANVSPKTTATITKQNHNITNTELDDYINDSFFDETDYELDFSVYYNDSSLEASMVDTSATAYENFTTKTTGNLHKPDQSGMEGILNDDPCINGEANNTQEELIYEDLEYPEFTLETSGENGIEQEGLERCLCRPIPPGDQKMKKEGFENMYPSPKENKDIDDDKRTTDLQVAQGSSFETEHQYSESIYPDIGKPTTTDAPPSTVPNYLPSDISEQPDPQMTYARLIVNGPIFNEDSTNIAAELLDNIQKNYNSGKVNHPQPKKFNDPYDVNDESLPQNQQQKCVNPESPHNRHQDVKNIRYAEEQRHMQDDLTATLGEIEMRRKNHEYFELERASVYDEQAAVSPV